MTSDSQEPGNWLPAVHRGPRSHKGTSDTERAIIEATERMLARMPLHELQVAELIQEAQIARSSFYFYFRSKYAAVARLLGEIMDEVFESIRLYVDRADETPPEVALRRAIEAGLKVWTKHGPTLRAASETWHSVPEIGSLWLATLQHFTEAVAAEIDRDRAAGLAPPGPDSRALAATVMWGAERALHIAVSGRDPNLPNLDALTEPLYRLYWGTIYGN